MSLVRFSPFSEFEALRRQMDRVFEDFTGLGRYTDDTIWQPEVELRDNGEDLTLRIALPGIEKKDLDISVSRDAVTISGEHRYEKKTEEKGYYHSEFRYGKFERVINLPVAVQNDKVEAEFKNGILNLTLPKIEEAKNRVVKIDLGGETQPTLESEKES